MSYLDVYEQAMQLPEEDRELLVLKLTAVAKPVEHAEEWSAEVHQRIEAVERGGGGRVVGPRDPPRSDPREAPDRTVMTLWRFHPEA